MARTIKIGIETTLSDKGLKDTIKGLGLVEKASVNAAKSQAALAQAQARIDQSSARSAQSQTQAAVATQKLAQASIRTATDLSKQEAQQNRTALSALRLAQAQEKALKPPSKGLTAYFDDLKSEAAGAATAMVGFAAAVQAAQAVAQSFSDAINFKANLDATTQSINIQLKGVRDTGQVWNEAAAYANEYKLTQQQTANTVQASVGILRQSNSSLEETFGVLQRLTVLAPGKSIEDAAFSVRELASGDITSIAEQFNISRNEAYAMRDAIQGGADVVQVLSGFLDNAGVSMDTLKVQTEGVLGAQKDAAIAAEQLALAQARFAEGPGLAAIQAQIAGTEALTQAFNDLMAGYGVVTAGNEDLNSSLAALAGGFTEAGMALSGNAVMAQASGDAVQQQASQFLTWIGVVDTATAATQQNTVATNGAASAAMLGAQAAQEAAAAILAEGQALVDETAKKLESAIAAQRLAEFQATLASLSGQVAAGHMTAGNAALALASKYGIASAEAERLLALQAQVARAAGTKAVAGIGGSIIGNSLKLIKDATAANEAMGRRIAQTGTASQKAAQLQKNYNEAVARYGAGSAQAIDAETALIAARQKSAAAATKAGGAAASRANAEAAAADKIVDLAESTAAKLEEIDEKAAERRIAAARELANSIRQTSADLIADQEANDLDVVGASEEQLADIRAREEAEAQARIATIEAVSEARRIADEGDAELAQDVLDQRTAAIAKQQSLDEEYNKKKQEFAEDPAALEALKKEYDEATAAAQAATQVRIDLARQESEQRVAALAAEKQAVLDDAIARAAAMDSTGKNAASAQSKVDALSSALANIPTQVTTTITVKEVKTGGSAPSSGGNSVQAAGGGQFLATSDTRFRVGESGPELVSVTPLTGGGQTKVRGNVISMAGGGSAVVSDAADDAIDALKNAPGASIPAAASGGGRSSGGGGGGSSQASVKDALSEVEQAIKLLEAQAKLADLLSEPIPPISLEYARSLANEARAVGEVVGGTLVPVEEEILKGAERYFDAASGAIDLIGETYDLREQLATPQPPINLEYVKALAAEARAVGEAVGLTIAPVGERALEGFERYADAASGALSLLADVQDLRESLGEPQPAISEAAMNTLAYEAQQVRRFVLQYMIPASAATVEGLSRYTQSASDSISLLSDIAGLRQDLAEPAPPIDINVLQQLAGDAQRAYGVIQRTLLPVEEETADATQRYADAVGASVDALGSALDLSANRFLDYTSPSDAQLNAVARDAQRFVTVMDAAAKTYSKEGLEASKLFAESVGAAFAAVDQGLVTIDKLRFSDLSVDPKNLKTFEDSSALILASLGRIGAQAAQIPASNLNALNEASAALEGYANANISLAAVPFGNLSQAGQSMGGGGPMNIYISVYGTAGQSVDQIGQAVYRQFDQRVRTHR